MNEKEYEARFILNGVMRVTNVIAYDIVVALGLVATFSNITEIISIELIKPLPAHHNELENDGR